MQVRAKRKSGPYRDAPNVPKQPIPAPVKASTVSDLISALGKYDPDARVHSTEPPFDHVRIVPQGNGAIMIG